MRQVMCPIQFRNPSNLTEQVTAVRGKSDGINASLCERRERIEELNVTRSLLRKVQVSVFFLRSGERDRPVLLCRHKSSKPGKSN